MKTQRTFLALLFTVLFLSSCSNDDNNGGGPPQYPMKSLIESGHMSVNSQNVNSASTFEIGYHFKSFKNGKITALGIRVPNNDTYRVTLWNNDTEEILVTKNIVSSSGLLSFEDINPIEISSGTAYFIGVNTNDYYLFTNESNMLFPVETEDFLITGYGANFGTSQTLPTIFSQASYLGVVDIEFIPNN